MPPYPGRNETVRHDGAGVDVDTQGEISLKRVSGNVQPRKLLLRALAGERTERPPIWLMRQAGRYLPDYHPVPEAAGGIAGPSHSPPHPREGAPDPPHPPAR